MDEFITLETLKNLTVPLAAAIVYILISAFRFAVPEYWTDIVNRIATLVIATGLVELGTALARPEDPAAYVAALINGSIVALAVIKAKSAEDLKVPLLGQRKAPPEE
ncbi:MAG: hypothetical protein GX113_03785 [Actinobacteria bacterium]|jgi:predicted permease|nr:hypothetical protein [Actinomycetota bacterium]